MTRIELPQATLVAFRFRWFGCQSVTPAKAGVQKALLDSGFRRNDEKVGSTKLQRYRRLSGY